MAFHRAVLLTPREGQCELQARQRRTQLMGHVAQQLLLGLEELAQAPRHRVKVGSQEAEIVLPPLESRRDVHVQISRRHLSGRVAQPVDRSDEITGEEEADDGADYECDQQRRRGHAR